MAGTPARYPKPKKFQWSAVWSFPRSSSRWNTSTRAIFSQTTSIISITDASLIMYRETKDGSWSAKALGAAQQARALGADQAETHLALGSV